MDLPFPALNELHPEWLFLLVAGAVIGYQLRVVVMEADPTHSLVGLDWGILFGAIIYYTRRFLLPVKS
jgi:hypothetical protein